MLTPLKERSLQECAAGAPGVALPAREPVEIRQPGEEIRDLRRALKESRMRLRRSAWESTSRIAALTNEVNRLSVLCSSYRQQLAQHESGVAIMELARKLMQVSEENDALARVARRAWTLERTIEAAHEEYSRLSQERDALLQKVHRSKF